MNLLILVIKMRSLLFGKTEVVIVTNNLNENTAFQNLKGFGVAAIFVKTVTTLQDSINIKSRDIRFSSNDENGKPFESADGKRFESTLEFANKFKGVNASKFLHIGLVMCLVRDTSNALH